MSHGPGRLQRRIVEHLEAAPDGRLSRRALEEFFVDGAGCGSSNLLRAIRSLQRMRRVSLHEGPDLDRSFVSVPLPIERVSDEFIARVLTEIGERS
jgi:hypothetical protein